MPFAEVNNIKICYEIYGEGYPLILVHGYDIVLDQMHEKLPNSTLKLFDKTGHKSFLSKAPEVNQVILEFLTD